MEYLLLIHGKYVDGLLKRKKKYMIRNFQTDDNLSVFLNVSLTKYCLKTEMVPFYHRKLVHIIDFNTRYH